MSLRNFCTLDPVAPLEIKTPVYDDDGNHVSDTTRAPHDGDLWVDSTNFTMHVYTEDASNTSGDIRENWVGVTDRSQKGSIVYFSDTEPTIFDIFPSLNTLPPASIANIQAEVLPGTMWYDTSTYMLKLYLLSNGTGSWVAVTSASYLTQSVSKGLADMEVKLAALEADVAALESA